MRPLELTNSVKSLMFDRKGLGKLIACLDAHWVAPEGILSITFVSHEALAKLHGEFCGDPSPTDIITFPLEGAENYFGQLMISPQAALEYSKKKKTSFEEELRRYVIHGYLHLLGFDDLTVKGRTQMRRQERVGLQKSAKIKKIFKFIPTKARSPNSFQ